MQIDWPPQGSTLMKRTIVANAVALSLAASAYAQSNALPQTKSEAGSSTSAASSQSPDAKKGGTDTVMITATKRLGGIQDVAVPVSAISGAALTELGISNSQELLSRIPSTDLTLNNGSTNANIYIRGIGTKGPGINQVSAVGVYSDEVSLNSPIVNVLQLFDLERVEVLRGPQNTLYGRNTTGGAINYLSAKPVVGEGLNGRSALTFGSYGQFDVDAAVGFDLGKSAAARVAILSQKRDGLYDNRTTGEKVYNRNTQAGRFQVLFEPSSATSILVKVHSEEVDQTNKLWKTLGLQTAAGNAATNAALLCPADRVDLGSPCVSRTGSPSDPKDLTTFSASLSRPIEAVSARGSSIIVNHQFPNAIRLTSITAYEANQYRKAEDIDAGPQSLTTFGFDFFQTSQAKQYSQELRLTSPSQQSTRWIGGMFFFKENLLGSTTSAQYFRPDRRIFSTQLDQDNTVKSLYGELEHDLTKQLTVTFGLRLTSEEIEGANTSVRRSLLDANTLAALSPITGQNPISTARLLSTPFTQGFAGATGSNTYVGTPYSASWDRKGWKLGGKYVIDRNHMVFANVAEGFKAGSFSAAPATSIVATTNLPNPGFFIPTKPETLLATEIGSKSTLSNGAVRFNLTAYNYAYKDQQLLSVRSIGGEVYAAVVNVPKSRVRGFEVETNIKPGAGWMIDANLGVLQTQILDGQIQGTNYTGKELTNSPRLTGTVAARRQFPVAAGVDMTVGADVSYRGSRYFTLENDALQRADGYSLYNAQVGLRFGPQQRYSTQLWVKNATNALYYLNRSSFVNSGTMQALIGDPRTVGITFSASL
jgi:iron complex outermembrane receptor protein